MITTIEEEEIAAQRITGETRPSWLNVCAHLDPRYGGISAMLPPFCQAINRHGTASAEIAAFCAPDETYSLPSNLRAERVPLGFKQWLLDSRLRARLRSLVERSNGIHVHGLWQEHSLLGVRMARQERKPYVLSAHGMLDPWALRNKRFKKSIYAALVENSSVGDASCLHALTDAEANDYRRFGSKAPVAVIPNGVSVPASADAESFLEEFPKLRDRQIVLFLGRIHFKKGLDILCRAWRNCRRPSDAHLVLAGPDFEGTQTRVEALIDELGIRSSVTFTSMLRGDRKWGALKAAQLFVLPSYSEGLSVSVIEAMGMRLPVLISKQCNVPEVASMGCGWTIAPLLEPLTETLNEFFRTPASERQRFGANGRRAVAAVYDWNHIGKQISAVYQWLEGGSKPTGVDLRLA